MRRRPIGQILVERNEISEAELEAALAEQERTGLRLGQILIETGRISWLALARAIAEQVLDLEDPESEAAPTSTAPEPEPQSLHLEPKRAAPVEPSRLPPIPKLHDPTLPFAGPQAVPPVPEPVQTNPTSVPELEDPSVKLHSVEAMLRERQRAFIELVTTTETLRMKVARLEEIIEERDRELAKLRVARAV